VCSSPLTKFGSQLRGREVSLHFAQAAPFARLLGPFLFPDGKGQAWLKHNIEEMGNLENFLPELYEREAKQEFVDQVASV